MEALTLYAAGQLINPQDITSEMAERWSAYIDATPQTVTTYNRAIKRFMTYLYENGIRRPERKDIMAYRSSLYEAGLKPTTIQNYITATRLFFQWTAQEGLYPNIADRIKGAKLDHQHKKDSLTLVQANEVIDGIGTDTLQGLRNNAIVRLMITGGLRDIEVSRANIEDFRTAGGHTVLYVQGKGHEERTQFVIIAPETEKAIRAYLKARGKAAGDEPLFTSTSNNNHGGRLTTRSISGIAKKAMQGAGYDSERLTAHSLRHTAVTFAFIGNENAPSVQQFARHTNINTTMIYSHALEAQSNTCSYTIEALLKGAHK